MTDLEITKLCAEAMGLAGWESGVPEYKGMLWIDLHDQSNSTKRYNPLHDDAQAMALVKKFELAVYRYNNKWSAEKRYASDSHDLNRAICRCVADMQVRARQESSQ